MRSEVFYITSCQQSVHVFLFVGHSLHFKPLPSVITITGAPVSPGLVTGFAKWITAVVIAPCCQRCAAESIGTDCEGKRTVFLSMEETPHMHRSISLVLNNESTVGFSTIPNHEQVEDFPYELSRGCLHPRILLVSSLFGVSAPAVVGLALSIVVVSTHRWPSSVLPRYPPDTSWGAWHIWLAQLSCVLCSSL